MANNCGCGEPLIQPKVGRRRVFCDSCKKEKDFQRRLKNRIPKKEYDRLYCANNYERIRENARIKHLENIERDNDVSRRNYWSNPELAKERARQYGKKNRKRTNERARIRRQNDPEFHLISTARKRTCKLLRKKLKIAGTIELIGCSPSEWWSWLEASFQPGMTKENYGSVWHVDHVRPCASFDLTDPCQQKECFHFTNTQPLFALDNIKKGAKYEFPK